MCKHIQNANVQIWTGKNWYDCIFCHYEAEGFWFKAGKITSFKCKRCLQIFRKDLSCFTSNDETCTCCGLSFYEKAELAEDDIKLGNSYDHLRKGKYESVKAPQKNINGAKNSQATSLPQI